MPLTEGENLQNVVLTAPIGICILDATTLIAEIVNDKFLEIAGRPKGVILGKWYWEAFPETRKYYEAVLNSVVETGESYYADEIELLLIRHGREELVFVTFVYAPVIDEAGCVTKVAIWVLENTKQVLERQKVAAAKEAADIQRNRLHQFLGQAPAGICILAGQQLVYELVNPKYQELLPGRELLGRPIFEALPELAGTPLQHILLDVYNTGESFYLEEQLIQIAVYEGGPIKDRYFSFTYQARRNEDNQVSGLFAFVNEVTDQVIARRNVEASEKHFRYLADIVPAKISNALPSGEVTFFNQKWLDYAGMSFDDLRDFGYYQMMHPDEIATFQVQLGEAAAKRVPLESEMRFKDTSGNYRWHLNIVSPVLDESGEIIMWVGSTTDIQRIKEEEQRKTDFIGMVSHELKTPLTSLNAYLQVLQREVQGSDDQFAQLSLEQSLKQVRKMTTMINGFLNVTRLESGRIAIDKTAFDIQDVFVEAETETRAMFTSHTVVFTCHSSAPVVADRDKIGQVLNNLISNAVKYSKGGSTIQVSCRVDNSNIQVAVTDQGIGIRSEDLKHVFDRYYRAETYGHVPGFGIGLYLSAEIIRRHQGKVWAESEADKGSTFYFSLPSPGCYLPSMQAK